MISVAIYLLIFVVYVSAQEPAIVLPQGRVVGVSTFFKFRYNLTEPRNISFFSHDEQKTCNVTLNPIVF